MILWMQVEFLLCGTSLQEYNTEQKLYSSAQCLVKGEIVRVCKVYLTNGADLEKCSVVFVLHKAKSLNCEQ